jgi:hypothetical protein
MHFFDQQRITKSSSASVWDEAMNEINSNNSEKQSLKRQRINQLFITWAVLDSENEQKEALKVIESVESVPI